MFSAGRPNVWSRLEVSDKKWSIFPKKLDLNWSKIEKNMDSVKHKKCNQIRCM